MPIATLSTSDSISSAQFNPVNDLTVEEAYKRLDQYRKSPKDGFDALRGNTELCEDPKIAAVFVECCVAADRLDIAEIALELAEDPQGCLAATLHMMKGEPAKALAALKGRSVDPRHRARAFGLRVRANVEIGNYVDAETAAHEWSQELPNSPIPMKIMAKTLADLGDTRAEIWYEKAVATSGGRPALILDLAAFLVSQGKVDVAKDHLNEITDATGRVQRRKARLLQAI